MESTQEQFKKKLKSPGDALIATSLVAKVLEQLEADNSLSAVAEVTSSQNTFKLTLTFLKRIPLLGVIKSLDNPSVASVIVANNGEPGKKMLQMIVNVFYADSAQNIAARPTIAIGDIPLDESIVRKGLVISPSDKENMLQVMKAVTASAQGDKDVEWWTAITNDSIVLDAVPVRPFDAFMFLYLKNTINEIQTITFHQENDKPDQREDHIEIVLKLAPPSKSETMDQNNSNENSDRKSKLRYALLSSVNESAIGGPKAGHKKNRQSRSWWGNVFGSSPSSSKNKDDNEDEDEDDDNNDNSS
jgi:hypothetical protein